MRIQGSVVTRQILIDGIALAPEYSQNVYNHSPDGFNWGYCGSGPAQLALAILLHIFDGKALAIKHYQQFKREYVANWEQGKDFDITMDTGKLIKELVEAL